ncbi:MAG: CDP-diacylglycerol--serine O-phosphatidyltransferase [Bacteroidales bacterium]
MKHVPNVITSLNLVSGFIAIIFAANGNLITASFLIFAAMLFDFLDGLSARLLKAYSETGKELDSLADIVSFGVAPALIIYQLLNNSLSIYAPAIVNSAWLKSSLIFIFPAIMPVCGALRLAKFNIDTTQATTFKGLPIPANALAVISIVITGQFSHSSILRSIIGSPVILIVFTAILSLLMVTRVPFLSLKLTNFKFKGNEGRYVLAGLVLISLAIFKVMAFPLIIPLYIISSAISLLF